MSYTKELLTPVPKVFGSRGSRLCHERSLRGDLWKPLWGTIVGTQADSSRILLAHYAEGHANSCQSLRQVSEVRQHHQTTARGTHPYDGFVAVHSVGIRYYGPLPMAIRQLKVLVVGIDYFTKWVEAEALATITEKNIRNFVWRHIICRYGIPRVLVSDNVITVHSETFVRN